jgi:hypothetical protein
MLSFKLTNNQLMIEIFRKKHGLLIRELYFALGIIEGAAKRDIDVYIQCSSPIAGSKPFWTALVDLQQDKEGLFRGFEKTLHKKIQRAADNDGLVVEVK